MAGSPSHVLLFLHLFVWILAIEDEKYSIYVLPMSPEHTIPPPCDHLNTTLHHKCFNITLSELIDSYDHFYNNSYNYELKIRFLSGLHVINSTQRSQYLSLERPRKVSFLGEENVLIICEKQVYFEFVGVDQINVSNIHFKNCIGRPNGSDYRTLDFRCSKKHACNIALYRIQITNENGKGIVVQFTETGLYQQSFVLANSTISTRDTGVLISANQLINYTVDISDTSFNGSCLAITGTTREVHVRNTTFSGCFCSPVISVSTLDKKGFLTLDNITIDSI